MRFLGQIFTGTSSKLLNDHELGQLLEEKMTVEEQESIRVAGIAAYKFLAMDLTNDQASPETDIKTRLAEALCNDRDSTSSQPRPKTILDPSSGGLL
jgi:DNA mismatch repair protein MSH5